MCSGPREGLPPADTGRPVVSAGAAPGGARVGGRGGGAKTVDSSSPGTGVRTPVLTETGPPPFAALGPDPGNVGGRDGDANTVSSSPAARRRSPPADVGAVFDFGDAGAAEGIPGARDGDENTVSASSSPEGVNTPLNSEKGSEVLQAGQRPALSETCLPQFGHFITGPRLDSGSPQAAVL
jgi:hypothetical protein